jgi:capsular exopolysaccharide synthesis family protein
VELRYYLDLLRRWWWLLIGVTLVFAAIVYYLTDLQPRVYRATTTIFVNQSAAPGAITYSDALLNQQLVKTYSQMAEQPVVLEQVLQRLPIALMVSDLSNMVSAQPIRDTQLIQISVTGNHPVMMTDIANATAEVFVEQQRAELPPEQASALRIAQPALLPTTPIGPNPLRNAILAGFLGLMLAAGLVMAYEYLDDKIKTPSDMEAVAGLTTLGVVTNQHGRKAQKIDLVTATAPRSTVAEAYRMVRTNLEFASIDRRLKTILITSANPKEGKSTTAANLATVLAQGGKQVILVDADLRKPSLHHIFGKVNRIGLTNALVLGIEDVERHLLETGTENLRLLTSGPMPPNPAEVLSSSRFTALIESLSTQADVVIIDSPPVLAVTDPMIIAARVDGTVLVVDSKKTRSSALHDAMEALSKSGTHMLGGVLNKAGGRSGGYYYYYQSDYGDDAGDPPIVASERPRQPIIRKLLERRLIRQTDVSCS